MHILHSFMLPVAVGSILLVAAGYLYLFPSAAPWEPTGTLTVAVYAVPARSGEIVLGFGLGAITLTMPDDTERVSTLTKRVALDSEEPAINILLQTEVPTGNYSGLRFDLKSPELRNPWQGDEAPAPVTLVGSLINLNMPFTVTEGNSTVILLGFETTRAIRDIEGKQMYLPVIQVETRNDAKVTTSPDGVHTVEGGTIGGSTTFGMDWSGNMRLNFRAKAPPVEIEDVQISTDMVSDVSTESGDDIDVDNDVIIDVERTVEKSEDTTSIDEQIETETVATDSATTTSTRVE